MKEWLKSVLNYRSYPKNKTGGPFFWTTLYITVISQKTAVMLPDALANNTLSLVLNFSWIHYHQIITSQFALTHKTSSYVRAVNTRVSWKGPLFVFFIIHSTGADSCYPASIVNLVWYANEKYLSCQHWATWGHEIRYLAIQKLNLLASSVCQCIVLLEHEKVQLSPQTCKCDRFARFCGWNCKSSKIWHQQTRFFTTGAG